MFLSLFCHIAAYRRERAGDPDELCVWRVTNRRLMTQVLDADDRAALLARVECE